MEHPRPANAAPDPLATALGNASLLGVGYWRLGRRGHAKAAVFVTVVLIWVLVAVARQWCEILLLLWWVAVVADGWFLAFRHPRRAALRGRGLAGQRLVAFGVTAAVVAAGVSLRNDAAAIAQDVTDARADGDCTAVLAAQDKVWIGDRIANAPLSARGDDAVDACDRLQTAKSQLDTALKGDTGALRSGFNQLASVLREPGNNKTVQAVLNPFLDSLPSKNPCGDVRVTDWLRERKPTHNVLDRSADAAQKTAPGMLAACGDALMKDQSWKAAQARYQQLLRQYPKDTHVAEAHKQVARATQAIELANVTDLLTAESGQPKYCSSPAKYSGAKAMGNGTNPAMFYGSGSGEDDYFSQLPASWKSGDPAKAVLVVCADEASHGAAVRTCPYERQPSGRIVNVTFHKIAMPVKIYELRTGRLVADRTIQISGSSCPYFLSYTVDYGSEDFGPARDQYVDASASDVRAAFRLLVTGRP